MAAAALLTVAAGTSSVSADPTPAFIPPTADWLTTVNYYRAMAGLQPVTENATWSAGDYNHSCYMLYNGITHDEVPGNTGYTTSGDLAGNNGNVAVSSVQGTSARSHIELWMTGPFHAIGILRPNLQQVGFGKCDLGTTPQWHSGATLDVLRGLVSAPRPSTPILFPGNGTTTNLSAFVTESPNPLSFCNWTGSAGLPVIAMMPEPISTVSASMTGPNGPVQTCRIFGGNTTGTAQSILSGDNAVSVIPRAALTPGTYTVTVTTQARTVTWSFTVDPNAATGVMPAATVTNASASSGFQPMTPFRFADSRIAQRITKVSANSPKHIKMAGVANIPTDAVAVSANITVVAPAGASYLTVYNCSSTVPTASTLNFQAGETMANAGIFTLSSAGELCVFSPVDTQLLIDVNGYFRPSASSKLTTMSPVRVIDTFSHVNAGGRMAAGSTVGADVTNSVTGIPSNATAVAVNVTAWNPAVTGWLTVYPCDISRPLVSNINPRAGVTKSNLAIVPLSTSGQICVYSTMATDLQVDVVGYFVGTGTGTMVSVTPLRFTDTRDKYRMEVNAGTGGNRLAAGQTLTIDFAGQRGVPTGATAMSVNVTATDAIANGYLTVWPCGTKPAAASLVFLANTPVANGMQVKLSSTGTLCVSTTAATNVIIDVNGWWN